MARKSKRNRAKGFAKVAAPTPPRAAEPAEVLARIQADRRRLDLEEVEAVTALRRAGKSWADIAKMAGLASRQTAYARYARKHPPSVTPQS